MIPIVLCYVLHFSATQVESECQVVYARSAHDAAMTFVRATPSVSAEWDVVWHTTDGNLAVIHYEHDTEEDQ